MSKDTNWVLPNLLVRQPILGTGKCIERRISGSVKVGSPPQPGYLIDVRAYGQLAIRIRVDQVILYSDPGMTVGEILTQSMVLLPTNEDSQDPEMEFFNSLRPLNSTSGQKFSPDEIKRIDPDQWIVDGCMATEPQEEWFEGFLDGTGYSQEFQLTREGREQFEGAKKAFENRRPGQMR